MGQNRQKCFLKFFAKVWPQFDPFDDVIAHRYLILSEALNVIFPMALRKCKIFAVFPILLPNYPWNSNPNYPGLKTVKSKIWLFVRDDFSLFWHISAYDWILGKFLHIWKLDEKTTPKYTFRFALSIWEGDQINDWRYFHISQSQKVKFGTPG